MLGPLDDRHALIRGIGYRKGGTVTVDEGAAGESIRYSGLTLRREGDG